MSVMKGLYISSILMYCLLAAQECSALTCYECEHNDYTTKYDVSCINPDSSTPTCEGDVCQVFLGEGEWKGKAAVAYVRSCQTLCSVTGDGLTHGFAKDGFVRDNQHCCQENLCNGDNAYNTGTLNMAGHSAVYLLLLTTTKCILSLFIL